MKKILSAAIIVLFFVSGTVLNSSAEMQPQYGGTLKIIDAMGPRTFYMPEGGPTDLTAEFPGVEATMMYQGSSRSGLP